MNIKEIMQPYYDKLASMERLRNNVDSNNERVVELDESMEVLNSKLAILNSVQISLSKKEAVQSNFEVELLNNFASELNNLKNEQIEKINNYRAEIENELKEKQQEIDMLYNRLDRLVDNKEEELKAFFNEYDPNLFANYGGTVKKDLEEAYAKSEESLREEIKAKENALQELKKSREFDMGEYVRTKEIEFSIEIEERKYEIEEIISKKNQEKNNLNVESTTILGDLEKYQRVDVRELCEIKEEVKRNLVALKNNLELELRVTLNEAEKMSIAMDKFDKQYDENRNMLNLKEWQELYRKTSDLQEKAYVIRTQIKEVEKNIGIVEITKEEQKIRMIPMNQLEKDEYDRRRGIEEDIVSTEFEYNNMEPIEREQKEFAYSEGTEETKEEGSQEFVYSEVEAKEQEQVNEAASEFEYNNMKEKVEENEESKEFDYSELEVPEKDPANVEFEKIEETNNIEDISSNRIAEPSWEQEEIKRASDFLDNIYMDIINSLNEIKAINFDGKQVLPNGTYVNTEDIMKATKRYYEKAKGKTFTIKGFDAEFKMSKSAVKKLNKTLKKCSTIILIDEGKLGETDLRRVYGKEQSDELGREAIEFSSMRTDLPAGDYVNLVEYRKTIRNLFVEKQETWIKRFIDKKRKAKKSETIVTNNDFVEEQESVKTR